MTDESPRPRTRHRRRIVPVLVLFFSLRPNYYLSLNVLPLPIRTETIPESKVKTRRRWLLWQGAADAYFSSALFPESKMREDDGGSSLPDHLFGPRVLPSDPTNHGIQQNASILPVPHRP